MHQSVDNDENFKEGKATRNLFRTDSDSESDDDCGPPDDANDDVTETTRVHRILNVELEEKTVGGSIEHRLWPAAEYLATFVLKQRDQPSPLKSVEPTTYITDDRAVKAMQKLRQLLQRSTTDQGCASVRMLELGAGIGLTGIALATHLSHARVVLTDLESALPLLRNNVARNYPAIVQKSSTVHVQTLAWGSKVDMAAALATTTDADPQNDAKEQSDSQIPLLILGSDCVYWESLYEPLERTIAALLQQSHPDSICLLAGMRRWKRDNHFYQHVLGKHSRSSFGRLECVPIDEQVNREARQLDETSSDVAPAMEGANGEQPQRQIMRIYAVRWISETV